MPGTLVEYARFVEVQRRRARIIADLKRPPETPPAGPAAVDECVKIGHSLTSGPPPEGKAELN